MKYVVLIGDVVGSKRLPGRAQFQRRLHTALQRANGRPKVIASPYTLTLGDEFQAVYRDPASVFADIFGLLAQIAPVQARFSLGVGEIVTPINPTQSIGMDGPAFHRARAGLEALKAQERLFAVSSENEGRWRLPNSALKVLSGLVEGWRPKRLEVFAGVLAGRSNAEIAGGVDITLRAVNKNIRAADLDEWQLILQNIEQSLTTELNTR